MIAAFAKAFLILDNPVYLKTAEKAIAFIEEKLSDGNGGLFVSYREGSAGEGFLDDYAFFTYALLELYESTFNVSYLEKALKYCDKITDKFSAPDGGFYLSSDESEKLIHRPKETYDGAIPSGNSVAGYVLIKLAKITGNTTLEEKAQRQLNFLAGKASQYPAGQTYSLISLMQVLYPTKELVCVTGDSDEFSAISRMLGKNFLPDVTAIVKNPVDDLLSVIAPFTKDYTAIKGKTSYYICEKNTCGAPLFSLDEAEMKLKHFLL